MFLNADTVRPHASTLGQLPDGVAGTIATLKIMRDWIRQFRKDAVIRAKAQSLIADLPSKAYTREAARLFEFVRDSIRYTRDVRDVETLHWPTVTLDTGQGDCDDKVMLLGSLLESIGHPTRLVAIGLGGGPFSHVLLETRIGPRWWPMDATENWPAGVVRYRGVTSRYVMDV